MQFIIVMQSRKIVCSYTPITTLVGAPEVFKYLFKRSVKLVFFLIIIILFIFITVTIRKDSAPLLAYGIIIPPHKNGNVKKHTM